MRSTLQRLVIIVTIIANLSHKSKAQAVCGVGYTKAVVNFDMQYFLTTTLPTSPVNYMFGTNSMRHSWTGTNTFRGVSSDHTGSGSSFGSGKDLKFTVGSGADTLVFDKEVTNLKFSVYDIDLQQRMVVTARNAAGTAINITTLARASGTTLTITGSGTTSATAAASSTAVANTATNATANVTINGPVKTVILTFTKTGGAATDSLYISDISACNNNSTTQVWPSNYQSINTPEAGQPSFTLACYKDSIMVVNLTSNTASLLYRDPTFSSGGINSLATDPYRQIIYYSDNTKVNTNRAIYQYNIKTGVKSTFIADVTTFGIQLFSAGLGSGAASFYNGSLFIGQDEFGYNNEPVAVYRIDIDPTTGNPIKASRFWSQQGNSSATLFSLFDWSDFVINNGITYNFNTVTSNPNRTAVLHFDMNIMDTLVGYRDTARAQVSLDYTGAIWHMMSGKRQLYNPITGGYGPDITYSGVAGQAILDAAESFKYPYDYGDAPASYGRPFHFYKTSPNLKIGAEVDYQVKDTINALADADDNYNTGSTDDEDGVSAFPALTTSNTTYTINVRTTNSTGAAASLYGYIDFNRDGDFNDAGEKSTVANVPNGTTTATPIAVNFAGLTGGSVGGSFIRFRLATLSSESGNASGYAATGEVEDYPIPITAGSLPVELVDFTATAKDNNTTLLKWSTASEINNDFFEVQRKTPEKNTWETLGKVQGYGFSNSLNKYDFIDETPANGINYYQLKQVDFDGKTDFSPMVSVTFKIENSKSESLLSIYPNPAKNELWLKSTGIINTENTINVEVYNILGEMVESFIMTDNLHRLDINTYQKGLYMIKEGSQIHKLLIE